MRVFLRLHVITNAKYLLHLVYLRSGKIPIYLGMYGLVPYVFFEVRSHSHSLQAGERSEERSEAALIRF